MAKKKEKKEKKENDDFDDVMAVIHKAHGKESLICGLNSGITDCPSISTRCLSLDMALGVGGIPQGRITEIYGPESSGKTTLALTVVAEAQARGGLAAFIDVEHAVDMKYAKNIGVDLGKLLFSQPDSGEQALDIAEKLTKSGKLDVVVVDSVAALVTEAELTGDLTDQHYAPQARLMSTSLRRIKGIVNRSNTALIFINQLREKVGITFGNPETQPGGRALKFYSSVRIDIRRVASIKGSASAADDLVGNDTRVKIVKNKVAPPFRTCTFPIIFGEGISTCGDLIACAVEANVIEKNGSWFSYNKNRLGQGNLAAVKFLKNNTDIMLEITEKTKNVILPKIIEGNDNEDTEVISLEE